MIRFAVIGSNPISASAHEESDLVTSRGGDVKKERVHITREKERKKENRFRNEREVKGRFLLRYRSFFFLSYFLPPRLLFFFLLFFCLRKRACSSAGARSRWANHGPAERTRNRIVIIVVVIVAVIEFSSSPPSSSSSF